MKEALTNADVAVEVVKINCCDQKKRNILNYGRSVGLKRDVLPAPPLPSPFLCVWISVGLDDTVWRPFGATAQMSVVMRDSNTT